MSTNEISEHCFENDGAYVVITETKAEVLEIKDQEIMFTYFKLKIPKRAKRLEIIFLG